MKGKKPHDGTVCFETTITNDEERLEEVFMADAEHIIKNIMLRTRAPASTHEGLAIFLRRIAQWDDKRPSMQDRFLFPKPSVGKSKRKRTRAK